MKGNTSLAKLNKLLVMIISKESRTFFTPLISLQRTYCNLCNSENGKFGGPHVLPHTGTDQLFIFNGEKPKLKYLGIFS
jgi:hypothetical protein